MNKISVEIKWNVTSINNIPTEYVNDIVLGNTVDETLEQKIQDLSEKFGISLAITNFAEHNVFKRYEKIYSGQKCVGIITVSIITS